MAGQRVTCLTLDLREIPRDFKDGDNKGQRMLSHPFFIFRQMLMTESLS